MSAYDPLDTCPYDPVHRIQRSRMQFHLTRCAKNFPCSKKKQCPYDARHIVNNVEYNYHVDTCPARESVMHYKMHDKTAHEQLRVLPVEAAPVVDSSENWEKEPVKSYNPLENIQERAVMRPLIGASKAQRKKFRMQERLRIQQLEDGKNKIREQAAIVAAKSQLESKKSYDSEVSEQAEEYKPLRRPKKLMSNSMTTNSLSQNNTGVVNQNQVFIEQKPSTLQQKEQAPTEVSTMVNLPNPWNKREKNTVLDSIPEVKMSEIQDKKVKENNPTPKAVPFTYAAALNRNSMKNATTNNSVKKHYDFDNVTDEKENANNSSSNSYRSDDSIIEKLSKTVEEWSVTDEGHKRAVEPLSKQIEEMKQMQMEKNNSLNRSTNSISDRKPRCAALFPSQN